MIIHLSILGIIIVMGFLYDYRFVYNKLRNEKYRMPLIPWLIVFGYIAFLAAMRSGMNDTFVYIDSFENSEGTLQAAINAFSTVDIKYKFTIVLENLFKAYISKDYHMWFLLFSAIESICFIHVYRKECYGITIPCFFFFASVLYYNYFSMMRQWMAVAIVFFGFIWLKERKWKQYLICCLVASLFHPSALFCIVVALLAEGKPWQSRQNFIMALSAIMLIFINPLLEMLEKVAEGTAYDYAISTMLTESGSSPVRIIIAAVPVFLAYFYRYSIAREDNRALNICVNMTVLQLVLNIVATLTSGLYVIRLTVYLAPYNAILYSYLLRKIIKGQDRKIVIIGFYLFYFVFYCYQMSHQGAWGYSSDILGTFS